MVRHGVVDSAALQHGQTAPPGGARAQLLRLLGARLAVPDGSGCLGTPTVESPLHWAPSHCSGRPSDRLQCRLAPSAVNPAGGGLLPLLPAGAVAPRARGQLGAAARARRDGARAAARVLRHAPPRRASRRRGAHRR
eukprot:scaffold68961_cov33-Phaeocystis_antarctica.AAC.1